MIDSLSAGSLYETMPNLMVLTLSIRQPAPPDDTFKLYTVPQCRRRKVKASEYAQNPEIMSVVESAFVIFAPPRQYAGCPIPQKDDSFTDPEGTTWVIVTVSNALSGAYCDLFVRRGA